MPNRRQFSKPSPYGLMYIEKRVEGEANFVTVRNVSSDEFEVFKKARSIIDTEVLQYQDLYLMVATALDGLIESFEKLAEQALTSHRLPSARDDLVELNSYFVSFIANFGMYDACVRRKISSRRKILLERYEQLTHHEFDSSFGYRLISVLRNYALHNAPPLSGIRGSHRLDGQNKYNVYIEKSKIIKDSQVLAKLEIHDDVSKPENEYQLMDVVREAATSLKNIHWKMVKALLEEISNEIQVIEGLSAEVLAKKKLPYIGEYAGKTDDGKFNVKLNLIPVQILEIKATALKY